MGGALKDGTGHVDDWSAGVRMHALTEELDRLDGETCFLQCLADRCPFRSFALFDATAGKYPEEIPLGSAAPDEEQSARLYDDRHGYWPLLSHFAPSGSTVPQRNARPTCLG